MLSKAKPSAQEGWGRSRIPVFNQTCAVYMVPAGDTILYLSVSPIHVAARKNMMACGSGPITIHTSHKKSIWKGTK